MAIGVPRGHCKQQSARVGKRGYADWGDSAAAHILSPWAWFRLNSPSRTQVPRRTANCTQQRKAVRKVEQAREENARESYHGLEHPGPDCSSMA
eukprot:6109967-Prymnesium_polylepis.2